MRFQVEQTQFTHQAMRAIGSGFQSVLFADVRTVAGSIAGTSTVVSYIESAAGVAAGSVMTCQASAIHGLPRISSGGR